jgi:hypothetical protein
VWINSLVANASRACVPLPGLPRRSPLGPTFLPTSICLDATTPDVLRAEAVDFAPVAGGCEGPMAPGSYLQAAAGAAPLPAECVVAQPPGAAVPAAAPASGAGRAWAAGALAAAAAAAALA